MAVVEIGLLVAQLVQAQLVVDDAALVLALLLLALLQIVLLAQEVLSLLEPQLLAGRIVALHRHHETRLLVAGAKRAAGLIVCSERVQLLLPLEVIVFSAKRLLLLLKQVQSLQQTQLLLAVQIPQAGQVLRLLLLCAQSGRRLLLLLLVLKVAVQGRQRLIGQLLGQQHLLLLLLLPQARHHQRLELGLGGMRVQQAARVLLLRLLLTHRLPHGPMAGTNEAGGGLARRNVDKLLLLNQVVERQLLLVPLQGGQASLVHLLVLKELLTVVGEPLGSLVLPALVVI